MGIVRSANAPRSRQSDHFREGGIGLRGAAARSALRGGRASGTGRGQGPMSVADNLGSHKGEAVRNAIRDVGACVVFLPKILPTSTPSSRSPPSSKLCSERRERELRGISDACGYSGVAEPSAVPARRRAQPIKAGYGEGARPRHQQGGIEWSESYPPGIVAAHVKSLSPRGAGHDSRKNLAHEC
jgi:hypothetical protein